MTCTKAQSRSVAQLGIELVRLLHFMAAIQWPCMKLTRSCQLHSAAGEEPMVCCSREVLLGELPA